MVSDRRRFSAFRLLYFMMFAPLGMMFPYYVLYLRNTVGLSTPQISYVTCLSGVAIILFQQFWGYAADVHFSKKWLLFANIAASGLLFFSLGFTMALPAIMALGLLYNVFGSSLIQLLNSFLFTHDGSEYRFGGIRAFASLGFVCTNMGAGYIADRLTGGSLWFIFPCFALITLVSALLVLPVPEAPRHESFRSGFIAVQRHFLARPEVTVFLAFVFVYQSAHSLSFILQSVLMADMGAGMETISLSYSMAAILEIPVFVVAGWLIRRYGEVWLLIVAAVVQALRWLLVWAAGSPRDVVMASLAHAVTFGLFYACGVSYINRCSGPCLKASGQTTFAFVNMGLAVLAGNLLGGQITDDGWMAGAVRSVVVDLLGLPDRGGLRNLYLFSALQSLAAVLIALPLFRLEKRLRIRDAMPEETGTSEV